MGTTVKEKRSVLHWNGSKPCSLGGGAIPNQAHCLVKHIHPFLCPTEDIAIAHNFTMDITPSPCFVEDITTLSNSASDVALPPGFTHNCCLSALWYASLPLPPLASQGMLLTPLALLSLLASWWLSINPHAPAWMSCHPLVTGCGGGHICLTAE